MDFGNSDFDDSIDSQDNALPEESSNRNFLIIAGVLGAIAVLALICIGVYALVILPRNAELVADRQQTLDAQDTEVAQIVNQTATAEQKAAIIANYTATPTNTATPAPTTPAPSPTSVLAMGTPVTTATATIQPAQATATALHATLTRNAALLGGTSTVSVLAATSTAAELAKSGFADEVGLPALLGMSVLLIVVIFLARRLRTA